MTAPLTPANCDLEGFNRMMIDIPRLRKSKHDALVDDAAWRAGFNLWFAAWQSVPAGSLEEDDDTLRVAAGLGRDQATWVRIRPDVLRPWVKCTDGRLYHPTVCELALEAWLERLTARKMSSAGNRERWGKGQAQEEILADIFTAMDALEALNSKSDALKKWRKRYVRADIRPAAAGCPLVESESSGRTKSGQKRPGGLPQGSQAEAEGRSLYTQHNLPPPESETRARGSEGETNAEPEAAVNWSERIDGLHAELGPLLAASPGTLNAAPLRQLVETEGIAWRDVRDAVVAIAKSHGTKSRPIQSFKFPPIADMAHANHQLTTGGQNGNRTKTPRRSGSGGGGMAGALLRAKAAGKLRPAPSFGDEAESGHEDGDTAADPFPGARS